MCKIFNMVSLVLISYIPNCYAGFYYILVHVSSKWGSTT
jgi:hypothetical protein